MTARAAFARPGPGARPFPEVWAPMQPSDSPAPSVAAPVSLAASYHGADACSWPHPACVRDARCAGDFGAGSPDRTLPWRVRDLPGYWTILFTRALVEYPAGASTPCPLTVTTLLPSGNPEPWAIPGWTDFGAAVPRPACSLSTLQRRRCRRRCKTHSWPAGLSFGQMGFAPTGWLTIFPEDHHLLPSLSTSIAWSHRIVTPTAAASDG